VSSMKWRSPEESGRFDLPANGTLGCGAMRAARSGAPRLAPDQLAGRAPPMVFTASPRYSRPQCPAITGSRCNSSSTS
jgi:hypothetical protein